MPGVEGMPPAVPQGSLISYWKVGGVQSPGARAGGKETATKGHLSGSTGRCCQLPDFRDHAVGVLDIAAWELPEGLGCICPGIPWHFWAGFHMSWAQTTFPRQQLWHWGPFPGVRAPPLPHPRFLVPHSFPGLCLRRRRVGFKGSAAI